MNDSDRYYHEVTAQLEQEQARDMEIIERQDAIDRVCRELESKNPIFAEAVRLTLEQQRDDKTIALPF